VEKQHHTDDLASDLDKAQVALDRARHLQSLGRNHEALRCLLDTSTDYSESVDGLCDLGDAWQLARQFDMAIAAYEKVLEIRPHLDRALFSFGCTLICKLEYVSAEISLRKVIVSKPNWMEAKYQLAIALYNLGQVTEAVSLFQECITGTDEPSVPSRAMLAAIIPGDPRASNADILAARSSWSKRELPPVSPRHWPGRKKEPAMLRLGYISCFFDGPNWMKPVWGLINRHDRSRFEIHLFSDSRTNGLEGYTPHPADHIRYVGNLTNEELVRTIQHDEIDILIDLNGYSRYQRLAIANLRPAPVIIGWFNLYATSGIEGFDYLIGDRHVAPATEDCFYSEKIMRVPGSWLTFEPFRGAPNVVDPPCSTGKAVTFGSAASQFKLTPEVLGCWSRILGSVPQSSLILKNRHLDSSGTRDFVHRIFEEHGINRNRVHLEGHQGYKEFLSFYGKMDIALETFPYGGATTTTDALWQGVPVITCQGDRWASRLSESILREAGLSEFITGSVDEYISLAVSMARCPDISIRLRKLRSDMREQLRTASICDTSTFARAMEEIYDQCWHRTIGREAFSEVNV
jgi:protein O-GlcNAc transferase